MKASLLEVGQKTPGKLRRLSEEERQQDAEHQYEIIGGHIRFLAMSELGWPSMNFIILEVSAEEAVLEGILDNLKKDAGWFQDTLNVGITKQIKKDWTQKQIGAALNMSEPVVSRRVKALEMLNQASREAILSIRKNVSSSYEFPEAGLQKIVDSTDGLGESVEKQAKVEALIKASLFNKLTESGIARLLEWVAKGNSPESFGAKAGEGEGTKKQAISLGDDPNARYFEELPKGLRIQPDREGGYHLVWRLKAYEAPLAVYSALASLDEVRAKQDSRYVAMLPGLQEQAKQAWARE